MVVSDLPSPLFAAGNAFELRPDTAMTAPTAPAPRNFRRVDGLPFLVFTERLPFNSTRDITGYFFPLSAAVRLTVQRIELRRCDIHIIRSKSFEQLVQTMHAADPIQDEDAHKRRPCFTDMGANLFG